MDRFRECQRHQYPQDYGRLLCNPPGHLDDDRSGQSEICSGLLVEKLQKWQQEQLVKPV